jgi:hypothetical protein
MSFAMRLHWSWGRFRLLSGLLLIGTLISLRWCDAELCRNLAHDQAHGVALCSIQSLRHEGD